MSAMFPERRPARGFAAATVIVILGMLSVFGTALATLILTQQSGAALDLQAARAYQAARSGAEFGIYRALQASDCATSSLDLTGPLAGFRVTVSCVSTSHSEAGAARAVYRITANACNDPAGCPGTPSLNYVERELTVTVASN